eukprot:5213698-Prymnesium_polylepis.1
MLKCILTEEFASEKTFGQAAATVSRRQSQDPRPGRARGAGAEPGRVVMGWSGAPIPPLCLEGRAGPARGREGR